MGYVQCLVNEFQRLLGIFIDDDVHQIQVNGRNTLGIALLLHAVDDVPEALLGQILVAGIIVDMTHHVDGHIHLLVEFLFGQLLRQLLSQFVRPEDVHSVQFEDNLVTPLRIVRMLVVLCQQVVLQLADGSIESGAVAIVEGVIHGVAQRQILRRLLIVSSLCRRSQEQRQQQG